MRVGAIDLDERVLVVAEAGNNHEGDPEVAQRLVREAAAAGADAVKFQTFRTEHYVSARDRDRFARLKSFELPPQEFAALAELAHALGLLFVSTPFDLASADTLEPLVDAYKIASGDNDFYPLLARVARTGKPMLVSSGVSDREQVERTVAFVEREWEAGGRRGELAVLQCVSSYPTPDDQAMLLAITVLAERVGHTIGYSDHTLGPDAAPLAVALGARVVEKHFTLDKAFSDFRDHQLSADPAELRELVARVRRAEQLLGRAEKEIQPAEEPTVAAVRRSIVAGGALRRGHRVALSDLTWIRPAGGLRPGQEDLLVGRTLVRDVEFGEQLTPADVE